jgi:hypothetical protein
MKRRAVVVVCQNENEAWALILAASRSGDRWQAYPFIFAVDSAESFFATCPHFAEWSRGLIVRMEGRHLAAGARVELLTNAVLHEVSGISQTAKILELRDSDRNRVFPNVPNHSHWGVWSGITSAAAARPSNLSFHNPAALNWLLEKRGDAHSALRILYQLVNKHQRTDLTQDEGESITTKRLLGKEYYKHA